MAVSKAISVKLKSLRNSYHAIVRLFVELSVTKTFEFSSDSLIMIDELKIAQLGGDLCIEGLTPGDKETGDKS